MTLVIGSLQLGFLYGILALGIYVTFRILNIPDKNFLRSYISYFFFIFAAISSRSIFSVRTRNGEIPCRSASLSRSAVSRS